ncbi:MAG TPA: hypothetical protein VFA26_23590 [Gemmataceae bacterium]|nr:hypothetical protein [Gemmataceae bacterium]
MSRHDKLLAKILWGASDQALPFRGLCRLPSSRSWFFLPSLPKRGRGGKDETTPPGCLEHLGFEERVRGSRYILTREGVEEILNLQPLGNKAKACSVRGQKPALSAIDLLIAATAIGHNLTRGTHDLRHYAHVPGLSAIDRMVP